MSRSALRKLRKTRGTRKALGVDFVFWIYQKLSHRFELRVNVTMIRTANRCKHICAATALVLGYYLFVSLGIRLERFTICEGNKVEVEGAGCQFFTLTRKVTLIKKHYEETIASTAIRAPIFLMSEGLANFLPVKQSVLELDVPLTIDGTSYLSWATLIYSGRESTSVNASVAYIRSTDRYTKVAERDGYAVYEQKKPSVSYNYIVPSEQSNKSVHFRCEVNCSAFTAVAGIQVTYHFPAKHLDRYGLLNNLMTNLVEATLD